MNDTSTTFQILAIDDDDEIDLGGLIQHGFHVSVAKSGEEALEAMIADPHRFDLILLSVDLPGLGSRQILSIIRESYSNFELPIIMIFDQSAENTEITDVLRLGASDYLTKPIDPAMLNSRVEVHLLLSKNSRRGSIEEERLPCIG